jgi:hypothetical protein
VVTANMVAPSELPWTKKLSSPEGHTIRTICDADHTKVEADIPKKRSFSTLSRCSIHTLNPHSNTRKATLNSINEKYTLMISPKTYVALYCPIYSV